MKTKLVIALALAVIGCWLGFTVLATPQSADRLVVQLTEPVLTSGQTALTVSGTVYAGSLVAQDATGTVYAASDTAGRRVLGVATIGKTTGQTLPPPKVGTFLLANDGSLTVAHRGQVCYVVDDQTVGTTTSNYIIAGRVHDVVTAGVWVRILPADAGAVTGSVTTAMFEAGAVDAAAIATGAVGTAELATGAVATADLADEAVTVAKLAVGSVVVSQVAVSSGAAAAAAVTPTVKLTILDVWAVATETGAPSDVLTVTTTGGTVEALAWSVDSGALVRGDTLANTTVAAGTPITVTSTDDSDDSTVAAGIVYILSIITE